MVWVESTDTVNVIWWFSDDEQMYDDKGRDESDKYQDKGVEDEEGLKKLVDSGDEEEEDEDKKEDELEEDDESRLKDDKVKGGGSGEIWMTFWPSNSFLIERSYFSFHLLTFVFFLLVCVVDKFLQAFFVLCLGICCTLFCCCRCS